MFAHSADSEFKETIQNNWKRTCTMEKRRHCTDQNQLNKTQKTDLAAFNSPTGHNFSLSCSTLYQLNIKGNCKKARTWNDRWPLNHSLWTAKHKLDFTLNRFSLRFIPYAFDFVYPIKKLKSFATMFSSGQTESKS